jgi:hypothetical protein
MRQDVRLFINDKEIEFSQDPKILLNYKETELHNPTIVRNSFTKQIQIEGTNRNNDIFGHIWDLTRVQDTNNFNPIKKTDFQLFVNDELFQKGYCKLDKVTRTNNTTQYSITLYGGLGSFFFNLAYDQDDESNAKKTLADLSYHDDDHSEPNLDFSITKDAVYEAWGQIAGSTGGTTNPRWDIINFIPTYNGAPGKNFDAAKMLINYRCGSGTLLSRGFVSSVTEDNVTYKPIYNGMQNEKGYGLGEMNDDMTEWETRDIRSYLQRPALSMYQFIQACRQPENNGGYELVLDPHFFHDSNPYYKNAWVTLPMLTDLYGTETGQDVVITGASVGNEISGFEYEKRDITFNSTQVEGIRNITVDLGIEYNLGSTGPLELYTDKTVHSYAQATVDTTYVGQFESRCGLMVQLFALDANDNVVGQSKAYLLASNRYYPNSSDPLWDNFYHPGEDLGVDPQYEFIEGYWRKNGSTYTFVQRNGQPVNTTFNFKTTGEFTKLVIKYAQPLGITCQYLYYGYDEEIYENRRLNLYTDEFYSTYDLIEYNEAYNTGLHYNNSSSNSFIFSVKSFEGIANDYSGLFSGTRITKERLLETKNSPADYLISYAKMFGLYFYHDSTEESSDPARYPSGVVYLMDRDTFYTDEIVDLSKYIDWNKKMNITPTLAQSKWYRFNVEQAESEANTGYKERFGKEYGSQLVNTNFNFNANTTDMYDGNTFKSGIMVLEYDKYFKDAPAGVPRTGDTTMPGYIFNGLKYSLFAPESDEYETQDLDYTSKPQGNFISINPDYPYYDAFPKLQAHKEKNEPSDGSNILMFFKGGIQATSTYWLTDDVLDMSLLNDNTPCWLFTLDSKDAGGSTIAKKVNYFPYFTRDLIPFNTYGMIVHSWNMGHPQQTYVPDTYTTDGDSIYDVTWKEYITDMYDVDTRKLTCYVKGEMDDKPWPYWFRRFYWFENSLWRLNEIKDLNPGDFETTQMEFIKVQDVNNYKLDKIIYQGESSIVINQDMVPCTGGTITGTVYMQSFGGWFASDVIGGVDRDGNHYYLETSEVMSPTTGRGESATTITLNIPENTGDTPITWELMAQDDLDKWFGTTFTQDTCNTASTLTLAPTAQTVNSPASSVTLTLTEQRVTGTTVASNVEWATVSRNGTAVTVTYTKNSGTTPRTATITATGQGAEGTMTATATITQNAQGSITVSPNNIIINWNEQGPKTFNISTVDSWTSEINDN